MSTKQSTSGAYLSTAPHRLLNWRYLFACNTSYNVNNTHKHRHKSISAITMPSISSANENNRVSFTANVHICILGFIVEYECRYLMGYQNNMCNSSSNLNKWSLSNTKSAHSLPLIRTSSLFMVLFFSLSFSLPPPTHTHMFGQTFRPYWQP